MFGSFGMEDLPYLDKSIEYEQCCNDQWSNIHFVFFHPTGTYSTGQYTIYQQCQYRCQCITLPNTHPSSILLARAVTLLLLWNNLHMSSALIWLDAYSLVGNPGNWSINDEWLWVGILTVLGILCISRDELWFHLPIWGLLSPICSMDIWEFYPSLERVSYLVNWLMW
jgi:hypothetical protein